MTTHPKSEYLFFGPAIICIAILLVIATGTFIYMTAITFTVGMHVMAFVCLLSLFLFLPTIFQFYSHIRHFLKGTPALIFTKEALIDNINNQVYKWSDIIAISHADEETPDGDKASIAISLAEPGKFINADKNPYKRFVLRLNEKYFSGAFLIQPGIVQCKRAELLSAITLYCNASSK